MPRKGLILLIAMGLLLSARQGWSEAAATAAAAPTTIEVPVGGSAATPMAVTSAAPAAVSATAAQVSAPAANTANVPAAATAQAAAGTATAAPAPASAVTAVATPSPAPATAAAAPAEAAAPVSVPAGSLPVRGMDMANVEHIFGTPLEKQDAVGKPPITRWVYADYVVYFEYNKVLHTVMKSAPFSSPGAG